MQNPDPCNVLIIDDSIEDCEFYTRILSRSKSHSYQTTQAHEGAEGIEAAKSGHFECILLDFNLPDMDALEILNTLVDHPDYNCPPIIILTGMGNERIAVDAMKAGACEYLVKDQLTPTSLEYAILHALQNRNLESELKKAHRQLKKQNAQLHEMTNTALRFVDDVAHEFRTPLAVILEFTSIIKDGIGGPVTDQQTEFLNYTTNATLELSQMVDDFLDSSRLKHKVLRVDRQPISVNDVINHLMPAVQSRAKSKQITIKQNIEPNLPEIFADKEKISRALINLIINAVKFSPENSTITIKATPQNDSVNFSIIDQGPGMHDKELTGITDRFKQAGNAKSSSMKGFGLGLNIVRELVWLNFGQLHVQSSPARGSTFSMLIPQNNHEDIITNYIDAITTHQDVSTFSILKATPHNPKSDIDKLRAYLASTCYPMDLIITNPDNDAVLLIGHANDTQAWIKRIKDHWDTERIISLRPDPFEIRWEGNCDNPKIKSNTCNTLLNYLKEKKHCA